MSGGNEPAPDTTNLRLPVPFFDLLMVLLVTCLVFVAPTRPDGEETQAMDIVIAQGKTGAAAMPLLPVVPRRTAQGWSFEISGDTQVLTTEALAKRAAAEGRKIALVVPPATPLQDFVDMQTTLSAANIPFGLAIRNKETAP